MADTKLQVLVGPGMTFNENKLTTDWAATGNDEILPTIDETGILIPDLVGSNKTSVTGDTKVDNITIYSTLNKELSINKSEVAFINSMCAFKVIDRTGIKAYKTDVNSPKTMDEILDEMNAVMNLDKYLNVSKFGDMYPQHFFQLLHSPHPVKEADWPCALDNNIRQYGDTTVALFVIEECEYNVGRELYITKLTLKCLWSTLDNYRKGETYTATTAYVEPDEDEDEEDETT